MPIKKCSLPNGKSGYKYGDSGKCYENKEDAIKQMRAIKYSETHSQVVRDIHDYYGLTEDDLKDLATYEDDDAE